MKIFLPGVLSIALLASPAWSFWPVRAASVGASQSQTTSSDQANQADQTSQTDQPQSAGSPGSQDQDSAIRVIRLIGLRGDVSFLRAGDKDWVTAARNLPLLAGDQIYTDAGGRADLQLDRDSFIRISEKTALTIADLSSNSAQFEVTGGTAIIQVNRLQEAFGRFEIDTPVAAVVLNEDGIYRIDVAPNGQSLVAVRRGGVEVTTSDGNLSLRDGRQLTIGVTGSGLMDLTAIQSYENWDLDRAVTGSANNPYPDQAGASAGENAGDTNPSVDQTGDVIAPPDSVGDTIAPSYLGSPSPDYVNTYEDTYNGFYGVDDLSSYGSWTNVGGYGNCWLPRVGAGWAPYRVGEWLWVPAVGWTWLSSEPWGWAPYHYGTWAFVQGLGWAWVPGFGSGLSPYGVGYYQWRPALVSFYNWNTPRGQFIGWVPLSPGQTWHRWQDKPTNRLGLVPSRITALNGASALPVSGFIGARPARPQAASTITGARIAGARHVRSTSTAMGTMTAGLPSLVPSRLAGAPLRQLGSVQVVAVHPASGIINRPVLTRHVPTQTLAARATGAPVRQHILVQPAVGNARFTPVMRSEPGSVSINPGSGPRGQREAGAGRRVKSPSIVETENGTRGIHGASGVDRTGRRVSPGTESASSGPRNSTTSGDSSRQAERRRTWEETRRTHSENHASGSQPTSPPASSYHSSPPPSYSAPSYHSEPSHQSSGGGSSGARSGSTESRGESSGRHH
ncbi:MAG TPA: DUF6600 domain-containing protein [Blastocatellia bacterium]|nr:DUF6600 domain-containing protein [Blastocatellia bacterium]